MVFGGPTHAVKCLCGVLNFLTPLVAIHRNCLSLLWWLLCKLLTASVFNWHCGYFVVMLFGGYCAHTCYTSDLGMYGGWYSVQWFS